MPRESNLPTITSIESNDFVRVVYSDSGLETSAKIPRSDLFPANILAWVNFNGNTSPGTIRGSHNVTSVTRNSTGNYTINFTTPLDNANYCAQITVSGDGIEASFGYENNSGDNRSDATISDITIQVTTSAGAAANRGSINVLVIG